jgi:hypothetical protein
MLAIPKILSCEIARMLKVTLKSRRWPRLFRGGEKKGKSTSMPDTADDQSSSGSSTTDDMAGSHLSEFGNEDFTIEDSEMMSSVRSLSDNTTSADSKSQLNSIIDAEERSRMQPIMARLDALQIQQELYGMNHPDVLFSLKHLGRAHMRREEFQQARLVEEMVRAGHYSQHLGKY